MLRDYQQFAVDAALNFFKYRAPHHGYVTAAGGSGKSHMIAALTERVYSEGAGKVVVLARSEKLLSQNKAKFSPEYQSLIGIYCAGLSEKDLTRPITIASAQSIAGQSIDGVCLIIVDECDEISSDESSQYQTFFKACGDPTVIGFTATPFRTGAGKIAWGEEIANIPIAALMAQGYLTPPTNKVGATLDLSEVKVSLGEYVQSQLDEIYNDPELLALSVAKIKQYSHDRKGVLIFCQSLQHCDILAVAMEQNDMPATIVSGDTDKDELSHILNEFECGAIKYLINCALLIRGYDMPCVDMIALLMATKSKRKFEQILYRGTRLKEGKTNFLALDMGNNFATHGPLGSPVVEKVSREAAKYMGKICPECEEYVAPLNARECTDCGFQFPEPEANKVNHSSRADATSATVYTGDICIYDVSSVSYKLRESKAGNPMIVVNYHCGFGKYGAVADFLLPHHEKDFIRDKVAKFMKERGVDLAPPLTGYTMDDLLWHCQNMKHPTQITVDHREQFPRIINYEWPTTKMAIEEYLNDEIPL